jgi:hypothetical protein
MPMFDVAGLPGGPIELPVNLIINLLPPSHNHRPTWQRQMPGYWVQHETDNHDLGAGARMHRDYLFNGAPDDNGHEQVLSYHFAVDDHEIYQMVPISEVTWQAADGDGPGNMSGISCEMCVNVDGDKNLTRRNTDALARAICNRLGLHADRVKRHWDFNAADPDRHHCPDVMMNEGYWQTFVAHVAGGPHIIPTPVLFPQVRVFHVPAGVTATAREAPNLGSPVVTEFEPGTAISSDGYYIGEELEGEARWLRTSGSPHLAIHKSGLSEPI